MAEEKKIVIIFGAGALIIGVLIFISLNKKEITNDVGSKAVFLPFFENDTMGIILLVES